MERTTVDNSKHEWTEWKPHQIAYTTLYTIIFTIAFKNIQIVGWFGQNHRTANLARELHIIWYRPLFSLPIIPHVLYFSFLQPPRNTKRPLQRREFYRSHPSSSLRRADLFPVITSLPLLFFRGRALFFSRILFIIVIIKAPITQNKSRRKTLEGIDHGISLSKITPAMDTKITSDLDSEWDFLASVAKNLFNLSAPGCTGCSLCSWSEYW